jgi:transglutaminase-like putative cysteine protease
MGRFHGWCLGVWLCAGVLPGADPAPGVREDIWEAAHSGDARVGFVHTTVEELPGKRLRTTAALDLSFRNRGAGVRLRMDQGTDETADGKVERVFMRQYHGPDLRLSLTGTVEDGKLHVLVNPTKIERWLRWSDEVLGLHARLHYFAEHPAKPGDRLTWLVYEPTVNTTVTVNVAVKEAEAVSVLGKKRSLRRVELTPERLEVPGVKVQLPAGVVWLDDRGAVVRRQIELEGLGPVVLTRTDRATATAGTGGTVRPPDVATLNLIPLNRAIPRPQLTRTAVYRITVRGDADPGSALVQDGHQDIQNVRNNSFELHVHPAVPGRKGDEPEPGEEYRASCYYINSDDALIQKQAREAAGDEKDPWRKAQRLERWVHQTMRIDNAAPMAPAGEVARAPRGDCRHYALLTAALCRAQGLPSRTAIGLLYVERRGQGPALGFHMWTEVWIDGQWLGLDATLGRGGIDAAHLKISHHGWHDVRSLTPLLPVTRVLGKLAVEVVEVKE